MRTKPGLQHLRPPPNRVRNTPLRRAPLCRARKPPVPGNSMTMRRTVRRRPVDPRRARKETAGEPETGVMTRHTVPETMSTTSRSVLTTTYLTQTRRMEGWVLTLGGHLLFTMTTFCRVRVVPRMSTRARRKRRAGAGALALQTAGLRMPPARVVNLRVAMMML